MVISAKYIKLCIIFICTGIACGVIWKMLPSNNLKTAFGLNQKITVICDAGHGAPDGGAVGYSGILEKDINLQITDKLAEVLENSGINVVMTRTQDSGLHSGEGSIRNMKVEDMNKRLSIIKNSDADLFVSIHMNAFSDQKVNGINVFYDRNHAEIKELAENILDSVHQITGAQIHDVKVAEESLYLMKNTTIPAILIECGFLSNPEEESKLKNEDYQSQISWAVGKAITEYFYR